MAALAAIAVLGLTACASTGRPAGQAGAIAAGSAGSTGSARAGSGAPAVLQFKAPLLGGGALDGTTYTGKPVAFWFWAPW